MTQQTPASYFSNAEAYDENNARWAPLRQALDWLMRQALSGLPAAARVLCVGAGTGAEILFLASEFPDWRFTAVEPSEPMLSRCRERAEAAGIASRCSFHLGYLETLPPSPPFDAATVVLVSQFMTNPDARRSLFSVIASRTKPGGLMVSCDLARGNPPTQYDSLLELWLGLQRQTGVPEEALARLPELYRTQVAVVAPGEIESLMRVGGFEEPTLFFQAALFHAWTARRSNRIANPPGIGR